MAPRTPMRMGPNVRGRAAARRWRVAERGYTLVETMIAVMLISIVVTSVFSLVVTAKVGTKNTGLRGQAAFHARQLQEQLRSYVRADPSMPGPTANWRHPNDTFGGWALQEGVAHNVSSMLGTELVAAGAQLTYTVANVPGCGGAASALACKNVQIRLTWTGPRE